MNSENMSSVNVSIDDIAFFKCFQDCFKDDEAPPIAVLSMWAFCAVFLTAGSYMMRVRGIHQRPAREKMAFLLPTVFLFAVSLAVHSFYLQYTLDYYHVIRFCMVAAALFFASFTAIAIVILSIESSDDVITVTHGIMFILLGMLAMEELLRPSFLQRIGVFVAVSFGTGGMYWCVRGMRVLWNKLIKIPNNTAESISLQRVRTQPLVENVDHEVSGSTVNSESNDTFHTAPGTPLGSHDDLSFDFDQAGGHDPVASTLDTTALEAALKTQLTSAQEEIAAITTSRDSVIAQIEAFKTQLDSITVDSQMNLFEGTLNLKLDQLTDQNNAHISKIDALKTKFAEQNHEIANLRATVAHYESAFKEQEDEADAKQGEHMATINKLKVELGAATDSLNTLSAENSKLTSVVQEANTKIATLEEARQSSEAFLVEANALLVEKSELQAAQKARLDEIDAEIAAIRTGYQKELDGAQKKFADNLECFQMLNAQIAEKDAKIVELQAELCKVTTEAEAENESNVNALNKMQMELIEAKEKLHEARQCEQRLAELQGESTQKEAELADVKRQLEEVQSTWAADRTRLTELDAVIKLEIAKIEALLAKLDAVATHMATGASLDQVGELKAEVAQKEAQIVAITAELDEMKAEKERVIELKTKLAEASQEHATLQASINTLEADLATAQDDASEANTLKDRVAELGSQLTEAQSLESTATILKERINELDAELVEAKTLASASSTLQDRVSKLELQLSEAKTLANDSTTLKDRISELERQLADACNLESASSALKDRVTDLESKLTEARTLETAAKTDLLEHKASLHDLNAVSADLSQRVEILTNQKTDLEVSCREALAQKTEAEQQLAQIRVDLEKQYQAKETELTNAATHLKAELESKATRNADLQREVTELREQVLELETRELEQTISIPPTAPVADKIREAVATQFNPIRAQLQAKIDQLINEKAELRTKMEIMQAKHARGQIVYQQTTLTEASTNTDEITSSPSTTTTADPAEVETSSSSHYGL